MHYCPTRVMASQVVDVYMETLLRVKHLAQTSLISLVKEKSNEKAVIFSATYNLIGVLDEIAVQSRLPQLDELLMQLVWEQENTFIFIRSFTNSVLSPDFKDANLPYSLLKSYRLGVVRHYRVPFLSCRN